MSYNYYIHKYEFKTFGSLSRFWFESFEVEIGPGRTLQYSFLIL